MKLLLTVAMLVLGSTYGDEDCGDGTVQNWEQCGMFTLPMYHVLLIPFYNPPHVPIIIYLQNLGT